jgi:hypothetical protein
MKTEKEEIFFSHPEIEKFTRSKGCGNKENCAVKRKS